MINEIIRVETNFYQFKKGKPGKYCKKCCFYSNFEFAHCGLWSNIKPFDCAINPKIRGYFKKL